MRTPAYRSVVVSLLLSLASIIPVSAEEGLEYMLFQEIRDVNSAGFFKMRSEQAPGYSVVLDMNDIRKTPARTLSDILDMFVPGTVIGRQSRNGSIVGTRGVMIDNNAKTLFMLDSQQINERAHRGYQGFMLSPLLGDIATIEVINGPGAIVHGSGAINGLVNMFPKNGTDNPGLTSSMEYGAADKFVKIEQGYGACFGDRRDIYIYAGVYNADGLKPEDRFNVPAAYAVQRDSWNAKGFYNSNYRFSTYLNYDGFNCNIFFERINPDHDSFVFTPGYLEQAMGGVRPKYTVVISEESTLDIMGAGEWIDYGDTYGSATIPRGASCEKHLEGKLIYRTTALAGHHFAFGGLYGTRHFYEYAQFFRPDSPTSSAGGTRGDWDEMAVFTEDVVNLGDTLTVSAGARFDNVRYGDMYGAGGLLDISHTDQNHTSPRVALSYQLLPGLVAKASYQQGFRYPDAAYYGSQHFLNQAAKSLGLPLVSALKPETMDSFELNLSKDLREQYCSVDLNTYYNIYRDQLSWRFYQRGDGYLDPLVYDAAVAANTYGPSIGSYINLRDKMATTGGELILKWKLYPLLTLNIGYGYVQQIDFVEKRYPQHQLKAGVRGQFFRRRLTVDVNNIYAGGLEKDSFTNLDPAYEQARSVFNTALTWEASRNVSVKLVAQNIFENSTPVLTYELDQPWVVNAGSEVRTVYLSMATKF